MMSVPYELPEFLLQSAPMAARELLGWELYVREADGTLTGGIITETEAYTADDEASHSYRGETRRNSAMFKGAGTMYVYFTYGMHWCCNIVVGSEGIGEAVLVRGIVPTKGLATIRERRSKASQAHLCDGPAKICQALGITDADNAKQIDGMRFLLVPPTNHDTLPVSVTPRIGIRKARDKLWRFVLHMSVS